MGRGRSFSGGRGSSRSSSFGSSRHGIFIVGGHKCTTGALFCGAIITLFIGFCAIIGAISSISIKDDYSEVVGQCVENTYSDGWYYSTYQYTIEGVNYENTSEEGWEYPEIIGKQVVIFYLISNPNIITEKDPVGNIPATIIAAIVLFALGGFVLYLAIKQYKKNKEVKNIQEKKDFQVGLNIPKDIECRYCGGNYKENLNTCPHCGAAKNK
ncbi:MAG: hypothetical protein E7376_00855 [Clostridiales bacterium]|nr:hypothetical protein [Clostridiales bacterium]